MRAPNVQDEFSYLLAADTFLRGRLANPTPEHWEHFESFHIIQQPTYASKYPPAQGLVLAIGRLLGGHPIVGTWLANALMCAAIAYLLCAWLPPPWAAIGAGLAVVQLSVGGLWAQSYFGGALPAAGGALLYGGMRRLLEAPRTRDALLVAAGIALLANSRPFEGALVALPAAGVLGWASLRRAQAGGPARGAWLRRVVLPIGVGLLVVAGWLAWYNFRVTGSPWLTPYQVHADTYLYVPLVLFGEVRPRPELLHSVMQEVAVWESRWYLLQDSWWEVLEAVDWKLRPLWAWYLHVPGSLALLGLVRTGRNRWTALAAALVIGLAAVHWLVSTYGGYPRYLSPVAGLVVFLQVEGLRGWASLAPAGRPLGRAWVALLLAASIVLGAMRVLDFRQAPGHWAQRRAALVGRLEAMPGADLVLVRYGPGHRPFQEWVYNGADLDAQPVLFARSIDPTRDRALIRAFPDRRAWQLVVVRGDRERLRPHPLSERREAPAP